MLDRDSFNAILSNVAETAKEIFNDKLESVILFGSYARGDYDDQSDIDIMIIADVDAAQIRDYTAPVRELCGELLYEYGIVVSVCMQDSETYHRFIKALPFFANIEKEGIRVA